VILTDDNRYAVKSVHPLLPLVLLLAFLITLGAVIGLTKTLWLHRHREHSHETAASVPDKCKPPETMV
jgi:hypothetical protein